MTLNQAEIDYIAAQPLGRLATVAPDGAPQANPVGYVYNAELGTIDIGGHNMGRSKKFRNVAAGSKAALVIDDIVSFDPWRVRGLEIRGDAEALTGQDPRLPGFSGEIIRIHPRRVISWGLESGMHEARTRTVPVSSRG